MTQELASRRGFSFDRLLAPLAVDLFIKECFEKQPFVQRGDPERFRDLFRLDEVDGAIAAAPEPSVKGRAAAFGIRTTDGAREHYTFDDQGPPGRSVIAASRAFNEGFTIVANTLRYHHAPAADLCRSMESVLQHPVGCNLYMTPPDQQGFWIHADAHDTFLVQIEGTKTWSIWFPENRLPLVECTETGTKPTGPPDMVVETTAGDLLYMPHGTWHSGTTGNEFSLHLTFGAIVMTWADLLESAVREVARSDIRFRHSVTLDGPEVDFATMSSRLWETARELLDDIALRAGRDEFGEGLLRAQMAARLEAAHPPFEPRLFTAASRSSIGRDDLVVNRRGLRPVVLETERGAKLVFTGGYICGPAEAREAFEFVARTDLFSASDLPGLDPDFQLALLHELVLQGLVQPADGTRPGIS